MVTTLAAQNTASHVQYRLPRALSWHQGRSSDFVQHVPEASGSCGKLHGPDWQHEAGEQLKRTSTKSTGMPRDADGAPPQWPPWWWWW